MFRRCCGIHAALDAIAAVFVPETPHAGAEGKDKCGYSGRYNAAKLKIVNIFTCCLLPDACVIHFHLSYV